MKTCFFAGLLITSGALCAADYSTVLFDDFSTDTKANYLLSSGGSTSYAIESGALRVNSGRSVYTAFDAVSLAVNETVRISFNFSAPAYGASNAGFRFGLFNSNNTPVTNFINTEYGPFTGYSVTTNPVGAASNPMVIRDRSINTEGALLTTNTAFQAVGTTGGAQNQSFVANEIYTASFSVTRTSASVATISAMITGAGLSGYTITREHSSASATFVFDGFALSATSAALVDTNGIIRLDNILVETNVSPIPEPSAFAALAGLGVLTMAASRRRRG